MNKTASYTTKPAQNGPLPSGFYSPNDCDSISTAPAPGMMATVSMLLSDIAGELMGLEQRLAPILMPVAPSSAKDEPEGPTYLRVVVTRLVEFRERLQSISGRVDL